MRGHKKNQINPKYLFIILLVVCIVMIALSIFRGFHASAGSSIANAVFSPMQQGINGIGGFISGTAKGSRDIQTLESQIEELKNENAILKSRLTTMENNQSDYDDLLDLTQLQEKYPSYDMVGARIIAKDPGNWYNTFTINKGSLDGIQPDMNVIADDGLVGIVTKVSTTSSVVKSIIDDSSSVSGMISKNYDICIVNGSLNEIDSGLLNVEMISKDSTIVNGDEVVTSYISNKFLPGLLVGYISDVSLDDSEMSYNAKLTPVVDFQHLSTVLVIRQLKSDLTASSDSEKNEGAAD